ncbi:unnamed protein product [Gadus morhua 'NCC']
MDGPLCLLVVSTLLTVLRSEEVGEEFKATLTNMGPSAVFHGESIRLTCDVTDPRSTWEHVWFRDDQRLDRRGELTILSTAVGDAGNYTCRGERRGAGGIIYTPKSLPHSISIDMGNVLLTVRQPVLVGTTLDAQCRVRGTPMLTEVCLYKDDVLVSSRTDGMADFTLPNVNLTYQGTYHCLAGWFDGQQNLAKSLGNPVTVEVVVSKPILSLEENANPKRKDMTLNCTFTFIKPDPAAEVHVYFYRDGTKLEGIARSQKRARLVVLAKEGEYSCGARVPSLNLYKWSEPRKYRP